MERFLTLGEVRRLLGVSRATLWRWTAERGLRVVKVGAVARVRESDLQAFLKRYESGEPSAVSQGSQNGTLKEGPAHVGVSVPRFSQ